MEADLLVTCPYNPAHRIAQYRFMNHVAKCKKSARTGNKVECPLDRRHIVDRDHLKVYINLYIHTTQITALFTYLFTLYKIILLKILNIYSSKMFLFFSILLMLLYFTFFNIVGTYCNMSKSWKIDRCGYWTC